MLEDCLKLCRLECSEDCRMDWSENWLESAYLANNLSCNPALMKKIQARIRERKVDYLRRLLKDGSGAAAVRFLDCWKRLPMEDLDIFLNQAIAAEKQEVVAVLLQYKSGHYSAKSIAREEERRLETQLGLREPSLSDWRKVYKISYRNGGAVLGDYLAMEQVVTVPAKIGNRPVLALRGTFYLHNADDVTLPEGLEEIGADTFHLCTQINRMILPKSLKRIGPRAFRFCLELESITIPDGVHTIEEEAFLCCRLKEAHIPGSVTTIGKDAFRCPDSDLRIFAPPGSCAETYAKENNIPFVAE